MKRIFFTLKKKKQCLSFSVINFCLLVSYIEHIHVGELFSISFKMNRTFLLSHEYRCFVSQTDALLLCS